MDSNKLMLSTYKNTIASIILLLLLLLNVYTAHADETIQYEYYNSHEIKKAFYGDYTAIEYTYDGSGNRITKTTTLPGNISISPSSLDFGSTYTGNTSPAQTITITNIGTGDLIIGTTTITGTNPSEFTKQTDTCTGITLPASGTCQIQITFSPTSAGAKTATLSIPSNDPDTPTVEASLTGTGVVPQYTLTVSKTGTGGGSVTSNPSGINCDINNTDCTEAYTEGTIITLTAQAGTCSTFIGWSGGGCSGNGTCTITINADTTITATFNTTAPVADFSGSPVAGTLPLTVAFTDLSTCATSWNWNFGDNTTSTIQNPTHTYDQQIGSFTVSLTATNPSSSNTITKTNYITVQCPNLPVRIERTGATYSTLQAAYNAAIDGDTIQSQAVRFTENLNINRNITITLQGGYDCYYTTNTGNTTSLKGKIQTYEGGGKLTVGNFVLEK